MIKSVIYNLASHAKFARPILQSLSSQQRHLRPATTACIVFLCLLLSSCASEQSTGSTRVGPTPEELIARIRSAQEFQGNTATPGELDVQPLRDPMVEDLRQQAAQHERDHRYPQAAAALDKALTITPSDPALLQERAEAALLQNDLPRAIELAQRGYALGAKVGPLCRRHWAMIREIRGLQFERASVETITSHKQGAGMELVLKREALLAEIDLAKRQIDACTVTGPPRY